LAAFCLTFSAPGAGFSWWPYFDIIGSSKFYDVFNLAERTAKSDRIAIGQQFPFCHSEGDFHALAVSQLAIVPAKRKLMAVAE
jgi:hypothetical protein